MNKLPFQYEVVAKAGVRTELNQKELRSLLISNLKDLGDDLVVRISSSVKRISIHIHTNRVGEVKALISSFSKSGTKPEFEITDLQKQVEEV
ncbi:hypothetical protein KKC63_02705 [Patescibacteria group bacterium]|nr:hypothetical protein [Patescibacteria group bacterium]